MLTRQLKNRQPLRVELLEERSLLATVFWNVDVDGFWDVPGNWLDDTGASRVPGPDDDVVIDRSSANVTVIHRIGTSTVRSLASQEAVRVSSGTMVLAEDSVLDGAFALHFGGGLGGAGNVTVNGMFDWIGGEMSGTGTTLVSSTGRLNMTGSYLKELRGRTLHNAGTAILGSDWLRLADGGQFHNLAEGILEVRGNAQINTLGGTGNRFVNEGWVETLGGGRLSVSAPGTQRGTFHANAGSSIELGSNNAWSIPDGATFSGPGLKRFLAATFTLDGTLYGENVNFSLTTLVGSFTLDGTFIWSSGDLAGSEPSVMMIAPGSTFNLAGPLNTSAGRLLANAGTMLFTGQGAQLNPSGAGSAFHNLPGGIVRSATTFPAHIYNDNTFQNDGLVQVDSGILHLHRSLRNLSGTTLTGGEYIVRGTLQFAMNAEIRVNAAALTLDGPDSRVIDEVFVNALANLADNAEGGSLTLLNGRTLGRTGDFRNVGAVTVGYGSELAVSGTYTQTGGRTTLEWSVLRATLMDLQGGVLDGSGTVAGNLRNAAEIQVGGAGGVGYLEVLGNYVQTDLGVLALEIGGLTPAAEHDALAITGSATLDGLLSLSLLNDFVPNHDDLFQMLAFNGVQGDFAQIDGLAVGEDRAFYPFFDDFGYYLWVYLI